MPEPGFKAPSAHGQRAVSMHPLAALPSVWEVGSKKAGSMEHLDRAVENAAQVSLLAKRETLHFREIITQISKGC